jgi:hypothetical protein
MPRYRVSYSVSAQGCFELDAADAEAARVEVERIQPTIDFLGAFEIDSSPFEECADIHVDGVEEVKEEERPA